MYCSFRFGTSVSGSGLYSQIDERLLAKAQNNPTAVMTLSIYTIATTASSFHFETMESFLALFDIPQQPRGWFSRSLMTTILVIYQHPVSVSSLLTSDNTPLSCTPRTLKQGLVPRPYTLLSPIYTPLHWNFLIKHRLGRNENKRRNYACIPTI